MLDFNLNNSPVTKAYSEIMFLVQNIEPVLHSERFITPTPFPRFHRFGTDASEALQETMHEMKNTCRKENYFIYQHLFIRNHLFSS